MNRRHIFAGNAGKRKRRNPFVCKRRRIAGIYARSGLNREADLCCHIGNVTGQFFFCGNAGNEFSHIGSNHIKVDVQRHFFQFFLMIPDISLGAQKSPFLASAENKTQAIVQLFVFHGFHNSEKPGAAAHVVVGSVGQGSAVVMGR